VILSYPKDFKGLGSGVMEYWSVDKKDIDPSPISPALHYSSTPEIVAVARSLDVLPYFWFIEP
jgi:hypothetical protein